MVNIIPPRSSQPIPEDAKIVFRGKLFDVYQWEQELYNGEKITFEKLKRPDTVVVFPVLDNRNILLTHQEQPGKSAFIAGAGGRVDPGEDILSAAKRELLEETGYEASDFILWNAEHPQSKIDWVVYTFIAKGLKKVAEPDLDGGEKIQVREYTFEEMLTLAEDKNFAEKEVVPELLKARIHPEKMEELRKLFAPL